MPLYRYRCNQCGHEFSERQRFSDQPLEDCPVCAGEVRRVINSVGIVFKGSGFYVTDNRNGSSAATARRNGESANGSGSGDEGAKPEKAAAKTGKKADSASTSATASAAAPAS